MYFDIEIEKEKFRKVANDILNAFERNIFDDMSTDPFKLKFTDGKETSENKRRVMDYINESYDGILISGPCWFGSVNDPFF